MSVDLFGPLGGAVLSDCQTYRYVLRRELRTFAPHRKKKLVWVMLNPSTADATTNDNTIRRCIAFTLAAGCQVLEVVNLFAFRATKPIALATAADPVGPDNDAWIARVLWGADAVVCAWGADTKAGRALVQSRQDAVLGMIRKSGRLPLCLGTTANGSPRHPLFVRGTDGLREFRPGGSQGGAC